jgi:hypothetical protein
MVMIGRLERVLGGLLYVAVQHDACEHTPAPHATLSLSLSLSLSLWDGWEGWEECMSQ